MTTTTATATATPNPLAQRAYTRTTLTLHLSLFLLLGTVMAALATASIWGLLILRTGEGSADLLYKALLGWTASCGIAGVFVMARAGWLTQRDLGRAEQESGPATDPASATGAPAAPIHTAFYDGYYDVDPKRAHRYDLIEHLQTQRGWSLLTFGPGMRTGMVLSHMRKEIREIECKPDDLEEWIDMALLAFDGAWRTGASPHVIARTFSDKLRTNMQRQWPDWRTVHPDEAIEHIRERGE